MKLHVNNEVVELVSGVTLQDLLQQLSVHERKGIAIALNSDVIPRTDWKGINLCEKDFITIITATQGG